jgi:hypothetical protein
VLEGFVMMALDAPVDALEPLISAYEAAVGPHRAAALEAARRIGVAALNHDSALVAQLDSPPEDWPSWPSAQVPAEPRHITSEGAESLKAEIWDRACAAEGSIGTLFNILRSLYLHRVYLKPYSYGGQLQIHIDVKDDQIFFGWPLHMALSSAAPLFRGMVVTFEDTPSPPPLSDDPSLATLPATNVLGIAKLKCLNYLIRTFGVRNLLPVLLKDGATAYVTRTKVARTLPLPPPPPRPPLPPSR